MQFCGAQGLQAATKSMQAALRTADAAGDSRRVAAAEAAAAARSVAGRALEEAVELCIRHSAPADSLEDDLAAPFAADAAAVPDSPGGALSDDPHALSSRHETTTTNVRRMRRPYRVSTDEPGQTFWDASTVLRMRVNLRLRARIARS